MWHRHVTSSHNLNSQGYSSTARFCHTHTMINNHVGPIGTFLKFCSRLILFNRVFITLPLVNSSLMTSLVFIRISSFALGYIVIVSSTHLAPHSLPINSSSLTFCILLKVPLFACSISVRDLGVILNIFLTGDSPLTFSEHINNPNAPRTFNSGAWSGPFADLSPHPQWLLQ